ncbi:BZ3500_MvSof-1268-A1-R1_C044g00121 [Microbotryum saponariae]|uniref:BZ3500_MvSof-1268-A1-R1_C044g00121 protein n=1 Tax=Microbotryum saponariae TaxID=289078 RepID=A0A2X0N0U1_9BASI|nr:BZ3500_MvSof-1268-A1-R1_Chr12-3g04075 [Microbotryum saponariae]SCZ98175.1 BZ3501_MvSof-1269-A2-R1_Chr7-1g08741 [Microbotryum saponariae]SDA02652.1 BZ3501_MvSof-1269-A2-R1_Chr12-3g03730 [Microbotryum saponariae]SDA02675.1 BZ3500_MvSof-1268-A1-R1_Chr7-1g09037 [Microbotryum saponariae]SDA04156.1 BZ3500_MvSof-1268-A1-R1_C044g00121 [Microbotryum saponariae]
MRVIARWPTRWHLSFAPNHSVTCSTTVCTSLISTIERSPPFLWPGIEAHITRFSLPGPERHCRPVTITSATPTSFTRVVNVERPLACDHWP